MRERVVQPGILYSADLLTLGSLALPAGGDHSVHRPGGGLECQTKSEPLSAWHLARVTPNCFLRDLGYGARSALLPVPPQLWAACLGWCWPGSPSWEMLTRQLLEGACIWPSLPLELGPAQPFWMGSLGTVRTCLETANSFCSQQVFVTHMPSSALSFPSTGWQKEEQLCS